MSDNPWIVDLSPDRMPEGWWFSEMTTWGSSTKISVKLSRPGYFTYGYGSTPAAALADAIREARGAGDDNG